MSETQRVYFSRAVTTNCTIYIWRHQTPEYTAVCDFCAVHDFIISERWHRCDDLIMITKLHASETLQCDGGRKAHPTLHEAFCSRLYPSIDISNKSSWLQQRSFTIRAQAPLSIITVVAIVDSELRLLFYAGNISLMKTAKVKCFPERNRKWRQCCSEMKWVRPLTRWLSVIALCSLSLSSSKQNVSNWSARQSIHQRVHWDEEINVSAFPCLFHLCQQALIQGWKAINWTYPKGIAHARYWCLKGCLGAKKGPCKSHGKGLPKQACPPSARPRTLVSTLGTVLKGHF